MPDEAGTSQKGKSGILASVRASVVALSLGGEPEKAWKLWKDRLERATRWIAVTDEDKLDLLLLVGGRGVTKTNPNTAGTTYGLQVAHRKAGSTLQSKS